MATVEQLELMPAKSPQDDGASSSSWWWSKLHLAVKETLTDLKKIHKVENLKKAEVGLEFISHTLTHQPDVFVPSIMQEPKDKSNNQQSSMHHLELSCWIVIHQLRILSRKDCSKLWNKCSDVIISLLYMTKARHPYSFHQISSKLVICLSELALSHENFFGEGGYDHQIEIKTFDVPSDENQKEMQLKNPELVLTTLEESESLQVNISEILGRVALEMTAFCPDLIDYHNGNQLIATLAYQLECGSVELKKTSLTVIIKYCNCGGLPQRQVTEYILQCIVSMLKFLIAAPIGLQGDVLGLETATMQGLTMLNDQLQKVQVHLDVDDLRLIFLEGLMSAVSGLGMSECRNLQLRDTVYTCMRQLIAQLKGNCTILQDLKMQALRMMLEDASVHYSEALTNCISYFLLSDLHEGMVKDPAPSGKEVISSVSDSDEHTEIGNQDKIPSLLSKCPTLQLLLKKLLKTASDVAQNKVQENQLETKMIELRVLTEILVWCSAYFPETNQACFSGDTHKTPVKPSQKNRKPSSSVAPGVKLMSIELIQGLCEAWKACLMKAAEKKSVNWLNDVYQHIVAGIGALLFIQDIVSFTMDILLRFTWILTLHWLPREMSWMDLKVADSKDVNFISSTLADRLVADKVGQGLYTMSMLPKEVAGKWRTHVVKLALSDSTPEVQAAGIKCFTFLLHHQGPNSNHLVYDTLHALIEHEETQVKTALAEVFGPLACVVSRKAFITRPSVANFGKYGSCGTSLQLVCASCDADQLSGTLDFQCRDRPRFVDPTMFLPFLKIIESECDVNCKRSIVSSLKRVFGHVSVRTNNSASTSLLQNSFALLGDDDLVVTRMFSEILGSLVVPDPAGESSHCPDELIIGHLRSLAKQAKETSSMTLMETTLVTLGSIAKNSEGNLLLVTTLNLLDSIIGPYSTVSAALAHQQLKQVAAHKKIKMRHLFFKFAKNICKLLVDRLYELQRRQTSQDPLRILDEVAGVFEFEVGNTFLRRIEPYLLPHLVKKATATASQIIRMFSKKLGDPNHKGPLARNIRHIYCHLVCSCEDEELMKTFQYLEGESEWALEALLRCGQNVEFELALQLGSHYDKVLRGIKIWASKVGHINETDDQITDEHIADLLQPRLLGILVHFDSHLNNGTVSIEEKKQAYNSIISLMKLMGPRHISTVRMRIMTTLKIGLRFKEPGFPELCCKAWNVFVRSVDLSALGPMLSQIVVNLQPLLHQLSKQVAEIYRYLIVDNRTQLQQHFHDLYFLPDIPELAEINAIISEHISLARGNLAKEVQQLIKGVTHESGDVRQVALSKLKMQLHNNQESLHKLIAGSETADPVISQLIYTLVTGCRESDNAVRNLYGECLGELGAVDPGRLSLITFRPKDDIRRLLVTVTEENFAFNIINELSKAFLRAEDRNTQDCVAFSLQDLITVYGIREGNGEGASSSGSKSRLWNRFSEEVKEIMEPLMQSKYMLNLSNHWAQLPKPIYRSRKGANFEQWVSTWTGYLISQVTNEKAKRVFDACRGVVKNDHQVALYLLPYVTVQVLLDGSPEDRDDLCTEILAVLNDLKKPDARQGSSTDLPHMSAQTVFSVLDHLNKCLRNRLQLLFARTTAARNKSSARPVTSAYKDDPYYKRIDGFIKRIPQDLLAFASYNCAATTRSLMHLEQYVKTNESDLQLHLDFLLKLYVALDEPDGVAGVTAIRQTPPSLEEQILAYESVGQLSDAAVCYDQAIQSNPSELSYWQGLLRCRLALGELRSAMALANGAVVERPEWTASLNSYRVEAAWKLGQWQQLETFLAKDTGTGNWNVNLGHMLLSAKNKDEGGFEKCIQTLRSSLMGPLSAASMERGSYIRGYEYIRRLHMLTELEQSVSTLLQMTPTVGSDSQMEVYTADALLKLWGDRLSSVQFSFRAQEPILNLRRIILGLAQDSTNQDLSKEIGSCWLHTAKIARKCALLQTVHSTLLSASSQNLPELSLERAKWLWQRGDQDKAQLCLEKAIEEYYPDRVKFRHDTSLDMADRQTCAKMLLLLGRYSVDTSSQETNAVVRQYKEVIYTHPKWEDGYFYLGQYYDKLLNTIERIEAKGEFVLKVVANFSQSLLYGNQFIYQSMPRMLSLWLDYGAEISDLEKKGKTGNAMAGMRSFLAQLNKHLGAFSKRLCPYQFLTACPQLISRICHAHNEVFSILKEMIARVLVHYSQQCVWLLMAVSKSSYQARARRCQDIYHLARSMDPNLAKFLQDATKLTDRLLELCNFQADGTSAFMSISQNFKPLCRLLDDRNFSPIMIPLQSLMTIALPSVTTQDPIPSPHITIRSIEDQVEILMSLQKPKKVTFKGSDGKLYIMLCKPKDDLRKDARLMEFNGIVNRCLRKDPESRRRDLHINTYSVTPLNEECGMLEWVSNTKGLRNILMNLYQERGMYTTGKELRAMALPVSAELAKKLDVFQNRLLRRHPPIFSEWFLKTFSDPTTWYNARVAYCRTTAVMSMVGYILGLGDRHGENILLDSTTGECLHVDFNCLFNKGATFDFPEIVPFRLTHNMLDAMGPTRYEGVFRRSCEVTMRVMRDQSDSLMSVLKTFIYDPLVEWSKPTQSRSNPTETGEIKNEKAFTHVSNIESRLKGVLGNTTKLKGLPLSVEGHVSYLIKEASDVNNLCQMYIGWAPYM